MSLQEVQRGGVPRLDGAPQPLRPEWATTPLPSATAADLRLLRWQGWMRFGIVAAIIDDSQRFLMLEHRVSAKNLAGALGPMAETTQLAKTPSGVVVESTEETLARALREELGLNDPEGIDLHARPRGAWELYSWPVGVDYGDQQALAVCPVLRISDEQGESIEGQFTGTPEIRHMRFMTLDEIEQQHNLRPGTEGWLGAVATSPLMDMRSGEGTRLLLPPGAALPGAVDARLQEVEL
jgi:hypothetical protein